MDSRTGIFRAILCEPGTLHTTPSGIVPIGIRKPGTFKISPFNTLKDYRSREMRHMMNFNFSADSYQLRVRDLQWLILFLSENFDAQIAMVKQNSAAASGGIFDITDGEWGLDFKFVNTDKERYTTVTLEKAMEYENAVTFIDGADSASSLTPTIAADPISGGNERGENFTNYAHPWFLAVESPTGMAVFTKSEILTRNFTIATKGQKNGYNKTIVDYLSVSLELVSTNATISKMVELLNKDMAPSLTVKENYTASTFEQYVFNPNVLTHTEEFDLGDARRTAKITFQGDLSLDQFTFGYGSTNGGTGAGTTESDKAAGGTVTLS